MKNIENQRKEEVVTIKNNLRGFSLEDIRKYVDLQNNLTFILFGVNMIDYAQEIGFDYEGVFITNPFMDDSYRIEYDLKESIEVYGRENVEKFLNDVVDFLNKYDLDIGGISENNIEI